MSETGERRKSTIETQAQNGTTWKTRRTGRKLTTDTPSLEPTTTRSRSKSRSARVRDVNLSRHTQERFDPDNTNEQPVRRRRQSLAPKPKRKYTQKPWNPSDSADYTESPYKTDDPIDHLDVDQAIAGQKYAIFSFAVPPIDRFEEIALVTLREYLKHNAERISSIAKLNYLELYDEYWDFKIENDIRIRTKLISHFEIQVFIIKFKIIEFSYGGNA